MARDNALKDTDLSARSTLIRVGQRIGARVPCHPIPCRGAETGHPPNRTAWNAEKCERED